MPDICLRTTFVVGFPGETEAQFEELLDFAQKEHFQCAGVFTYSQEEETEAGAMKNQIDEATKQERYHRLMALQAKISEEIQQEREGKVLTVLVEGHDEKIRTLLWRGPMRKLLILTVRSLLKVLRDFG